MYVHIMTYNMAMGAKRDDSKPLIPKDDALDFRMVTSPHRPSDIRESDRLFKDKLVWI